MLVEFCCCAHFCGGLLIMSMLMLACVLCDACAVVMYGFYVICVKNKGDVDAAFGWDK